MLATAPAPDIAGRPLSVFLEWVTREGGWTVRFADAETAELAATTTLHGDVESLTLAEASSMVFQGSGLDYRLEGETFFVARAEAEESTPISHQKPPVRARVPDETVYNGHSNSSAR